MGSINCRLCGSVKIASLPTFGRFPFANIFPNDPKALIAAHNLQLCVCEDCGLCQLSDFPNTSELFDDSFAIYCLLLYIEFENILAFSYSSSSIFSIDSAISSISKT
jgi:hypothetical protein